MKLISKLACALALALPCAAVMASTSNNVATSSYLMNMEDVDVKLLTGTFAHQISFNGKEGYAYIKLKPEGSEHHHEFVKLDLELRIVNPDAEPIYDYTGLALVRGNEFVSYSNDDPSQFIKGEYLAGEGLIRVKEFNLSFADGQKLIGDYTGGVKYPAYIYRTPDQVLKYDEVVGKYDYQNPQAGGSIEITTKAKLDKGEEWPVYFVLNTTTGGETVDSAKCTFTGFASLVDNEPFVVKSLTNKEDELKVLYYKNSLYVLDAKTKNKLCDITGNMIGQYLKSK